MVSFGFTMSVPAQDTDQRWRRSWKRGGHHGEASVVNLGYASTRWASSAEPVVSQDWDYGRQRDEPRPTPREDDAEESQQGESVVRYSGAAFGAAVVPPLLLYVFGWSVGWIRRGFQG